ncbi:MAG: hypothetical protein JW730_20720 [Anaerolineales bacterium]|nr:hypothetical protein [Anaerolineales bacterium]
MSKKASSHSKENPSVPNAGNEVIDRLKGFRVLRNRRIQTVFSWIPALLLLLVLADWLIGAGAFSRDTFRMTGVLTVAFILLSIQSLFDRLPRVLETIWRRGLIDVQSGNAETNKFLEYLDQFEAALNAKYERGLALIFAIGSLFATYPFRYLMVAKRFPFDFPATLSYYFGGQAGIIAPVLGFVVGMLAWRVGTIAYFIGAIGERFPLKIQINHHDQSGGLKPLGDLAFNIAIIILIPAIFLAVWGFITTFFRDPSLELYITLWGGLFRQLLVILGILSLFAFIQPLYKIHLRMDEHARKIQAELDSLSQKIEALSHELRSQADEIGPQAGEDQLRTIEFMKRVYNENSQIPTWPFNWKTLFRFASAQAVPLLSLLGTSGPVIEIIKGLFSLTD